jgi:hypothetical protein
VSESNGTPWVCANCGKSGNSRYRLPWFKAAILSIVLLAPLWGDICEACRDKVNTIFVGVVVAIASVAVLGSFVLISKLA